jgi:hypothetical protein
VGVAVLSLTMMLYEKAMRSGFYFCDTHWPGTDALIGIDDERLHVIEWRRFANLQAMGETENNSIPASLRHIIVALRRKMPFNVTIIIYSLGCFWTATGGYFNNVLVPRHCIMGVHS